MAEDTVCKVEPLFKKWSSYNKRPCKDNTCGVKAHTVEMSFDGGFEHADGTRWAIMPIMPPMHILEVFVKAKGMAGVTVDLGMVSCEPECGKEPCINWTQFLDKLNVAEDGCQRACILKHISGDSCAPDCCPVNPNTSCCPAEESDCCDGMGDMVLTLNGTPPACSSLSLTFIYTG